MLPLRAHCAGTKPQSRLFVEGVLRKGARVALGDGHIHKLLHVLRLEDGAPLCLFNGSDGSWAARLRRQGSGVWAETTTRLCRQPPPSSLRVLFAPPKGARLDELVARATELGAGDMTPVFSRRTIARRLRLERLGAIARSAAEQCGRLDVPRLQEPLPLSLALSRWPPTLPLCVGDENAAGGDSLPHLLAVLASLTRLPPLLTGPEGGWAEEERELFLTLPFVHRVSLGPCLLRSETAVAAGLACMQGWRLAGGSVKSDGGVLSGHVGDDAERQGWRQR